MTQHPGGERLTLRAARLAGLARGMTLLDIGCGDGTSIRLLAREYGVAASGIDLADRNDARTAALGDKLDAVMLECSLSVIGDAEHMLRRVYGALKTGGTLIISDVYKKTNPGALSTQVKSAGFDILICEDHTPALVTYAAERFCSGSAGYGYELIIARK